MVVNGDNGRKANLPQQLARIQVIAAQMQIPSSRVKLNEHRRPTHEVLPRLFSELDNQLGTLHVLHESTHHCSRLTILALREDVSSEYAHVRKGTDSAGQTRDG